MLTLLALASACGQGRTRDGYAERARGAGEPASDPIAVSAGEREVRVRCALACELARAELGRLRDECLGDPLATPHQLVAQGTGLSELGCCTESEHAYTLACGAETLAPCISRWSAECAAAALARGTGRAGRRAGSR